MLRAAACAAALALVIPMITDVSAARAVVDDDPASATSADTAQDSSAATDESAEPDPTSSTDPTPSPDATATPTPAPTPTAPAADEAEPVEPAAPSLRAAPEAVTLAQVPVPSVQRINAGADTFAASVLASQALFPSGADTVVLVNGSYPIFASAAAPLIAERGASLLYVQAAAIPATVLTELRRLAPSSIVVVGGPGYVSDAVMSAARTVAPTVSRIGGSSLYETSRLVFAQVSGASDTVYIAGGKTNYDAPLAAVMARATGKKTLIVNGHSAPLDAATVDLLRSAGTQRVVIVRSLAAAMAPAYEPALRSAGFATSRLAHIDPPTLSMIVAADAGASRQVSMLVNKDRPAHVGIAAAAAAALGQPLYYPRSECVQDNMAAQIAAAGVRLLPVGDTAALAPAVATNTTCTVVTRRLQTDLHNAITSTMSRYSGTYSVTVLELNGLGQGTNVGGGIRREPASMMKIFAAWAAYKRIEQGAASTSTRLPSGLTIGTCISLMIHVSDNYCHTDIVHWIGISNINAMIRGAGLTNTYYGSVPRGTSVLYAGNRSTSNDLALLMRKLHSGSILSKPHVDALFKVMGMQIGRSRIASGIPVGVKQVTKPGALWVASGLMQGDTGIVYGPKSTFVISIVGDNHPPKEAFQAITRTVYQHFHGAFGAAASYPREQMTTTKPVGLRSSANGPVVVVVPGGTNVEQLDSIRDWYLVQYGSRKLWVYYSGLRNR
ncbi:hypothetical protein GCM10027024_16530 [Microbacterium insulae]